MLGQETEVLDADLTLPFIIGGNTDISVPFLSLSMVIRKLRKTQKHKTHN